MDSDSKLQNSYYTSNTLDSRKIPVFLSKEPIHDQRVLAITKNYSGLVLAGITGLAGVFISIVAYPFVSPALRKICLPYVPATDQQVSNIMKALNGRKGKAIDLGSGDGRIVLKIAKHQKCQVTGIELNPWLVLYSKIQARTKNLSAYASFSRQDLWKYNLKSYENIVVFGVEEMMIDLEQKLEREMNVGAIVVACRFPLPGWTPCTTLGVGIDTVWVYEKK